MICLFFFLINFYILGNKVEDGEIIEDAEEVKDGKRNNAAMAKEGTADPMSSSLQQSGRSWKDGNQRSGKNVSTVSPILENLILNGASYFIYLICFFLFCNPVFRILKFQQLSKFPGYCRRLKTQVWLVEISECWGSFWGL